MQFPDHFYILLFCGLYSLVIFFSTPLRVKGSFWINANPIPSSDLTALAGWPEVGEFLDLEVELESLGFEKGELLVFPDLFPNAIVVMLPFKKHDVACFAALSVTLVRTYSSWSVSDRKISLQTSFSDESSVVTEHQFSNACFGGPEKQQRFVVTWTEDIVELYSMHGRLVEHLGGRLEKVDAVAQENSGDFAAAITQGTVKELERNCKCGFLYLEEAQKDYASSPNPYAAPSSFPRSDRYRLTWTGAYVSTWGNMWPAKQIIRWNSTRKTRNMLRRC